MELLFKEFVPWIVFLYFLRFRYKYHENDLLVVLIFTFIPIFSSNFSIFFYRPLQQSFFIILILMSFLYYYFNQKTIINKNILYMTIYGLFIILSAFNDIVSINLYISSLINFIILYFIILYLYIRIDTRSKLIEIFMLISHISLIMAVLSCIVYFLEPTRLEGTYTNSNYYALFLYIGFVSTLFLNEKWKIIRLIILIVAIVFTGSRIVQMAIPLVLIIYFYHAHFSIIKTFFLITILLPISGIIVYLYILESNAMINAKTNRFANIEEDASTLERLAIIETAKVIVRKEPINGIGYAQYQVKFKKYITNSKLSYYLKRRKEIVTHNDYIRIIVELGIPALLFMFFIIYQQFKSYNNQDTLSVMSISILLGVLLFSVAHNNMNSLFFWFFLFLPKYVRELEPNNV